MLLGGNLSSLTKTQLSLICCGRRFLPIRPIHKSIKLNSEPTADPGRANTHKPDKWDQRMLVWMKKYPNIEAIPSTVSATAMDRVRNQVRIRVNIALCIMTGVCSFLVYQYGKRKTLAGEGMFSPHKSPPSSSS